MVGPPHRKQKKDMSKMKRFSCKKNGHYASQCPNKKKGKGKKVDLLGNDNDEFATKCANEFSLFHHGLGTEANGAWPEDIDAWVVDNGASSHMTGVRSMLLSVLETDSDYCVKSGMHTKYAVKGVGTVVFQLESEGSLEVVGVMYVPRLSVNLLSVSAFEDTGYAITFEDGQVLIWSKGADTPNAAMKLGIEQGTMYRLLEQPIVKSKGILDRGSMLVTKGELECSLSKPTWYEITLKEAQEQDPRSMVEALPDQISTQVARGSSNSEGVTIAVRDVIDPGGGPSKSTLLAKEC